jgi:hypothetical protein
MMTIEDCTGLEILRTRGTPVELIGSALAAGDIALANAAFRTVVLEYIYEKVDEYGSDCNVVFVHSHKLSENAELHTIKSGTAHATISDHIQSTVMSVIEHVSGDIYTEIEDILTKTQEQHTGSPLTVGIVVDQFEFDLQANERYVKATATIPVQVYWTPAN